MGGKASKCTKAANTSTPPNTPQAAAQPSSSLKSQSASYPKDISAGGAAAIAARRASLVTPGSGSGLFPTNDVPGVNYSPGRRSSNAGIAQLSVFTNPTIDGRIQIALVPHEHTLFCERKQRVCQAVNKKQELETLEVNLDFYAVHYDL